MYYITFILAAFMVSAALFAENSQDDSRFDILTLNEETQSYPWFTYPNSRLVLNYYAVEHFAIPHGLSDSLQVNAAYYVGEKPERLPFLWSWSTQKNDDIVEGIQVDFSQDKWDADAVVVEYQNSQAKLTLGESYFGSITREITIDLDQTPCISISVSESEGSWAVKAQLGGDDDITLIGDNNQVGRFISNVRDSTGWTGKKTFKVRLYVVGQNKSVTFENLAFYPTSEDKTKNPTIWLPHYIMQSAQQKDGEIETETFFFNEDTLAQKLSIPADQSEIRLDGRFPGNAKWDDEKQALVLTHDDFHAVIALDHPAEFIGSSNSIWSLNLKNMETTEIALASSFSPNNDIESTIKKAKSAANLALLEERLSERKSEWSEWLSKIPHPLSFDLHLLERNEATSQEIRRMYYKAWVFLISGSIPPMPENDFPWPQVACGKPSLWDEGHPQARPTAQWESVLGMQFLAMADSETPWKAFEGMMALVDDEGGMAGEGLPSRHMQTAWILHSLTNDTERLRTAYPDMKRFLIWKAEDPRWLHHNLVPEGTKDIEFVFHALMDMLYAIKIAQTLELPDEVNFWEAQIEQLSENFSNWFWETPGGKPSRLHWKGHFQGTSSTWCLPALVLPSSILKEDERDSLLSLLREHLNDDVPFLIWHLNKHPTYIWAMEGMWQYGTPVEVARMAEAAMSAVTMSGEFGENYTDSFPVKPTGVVPSLFGAMNIIDASLWHNGVALGGRLPVLRRMPNAVGVENIHAKAGKISVRYLPDDKVELRGSGLGNLQIPEGFEISTANGVPVWKGRLSVGEELVLVER